MLELVGYHHLGIQSIRPNLHLLLQQPQLFHLDLQSHLQLSPVLKHQLLFQCLLVRLQVFLELLELF